MNAITLFDRPFDMSKGIDLINRDGVVVRHFVTLDEAMITKAYALASAIRAQHPEYGVRYFVKMEEVEA